MRPPRHAFSAAALAAGAAVLGGVVAFVLGALPRASGAQAVFATALLCLVAAAALGPFLFTATEGAPRWRPAVHGALRAAAFGAGAAAACALVALARDAAVAAALAAGSLAGLCGFAAGAAAWALGGGPARIAVAAAALLCLATPFYWDDAFLLRAGDRKASAARAYRINPAAAAGTTLGYSWFLAPEVYRNNQTAESLGVGVRLGGAGDFALRLAPLAAVAAAAGLWRRP